MENPQKQKHNQQPSTASLSFNFTALPIELKHDILSRLPSKPLHIFKSVSKQWLSIITSPEFIRFHTLHSLSSSPRSNRILVFDLFHYLSTLEIDITSNNNNNETNFPISVHTNTIVSGEGKETASRIDLVGSCNGLVCFSKRTFSHRGFLREHLFVYNPFTRGPFREIPVQELGHRVYGFGYNAAADDYKIMVVHNHEVRPPPRGYFQASQSDLYSTEVFSLRYKLWTPVDDCCYGKQVFKYDSFGRYVQGFLHWVVNDARSHKSTQVRIVKFDMSCDKYTLMMLPRELSKGFAEDEGLVEVEILDGSLCLQVMKYDCNGKRKHQCDVWVMKEYGVSESWSRLFSIGLIGYPTEGIVGRKVRMKVVAYSTSGDRVLVIRGEKFYWYDTEGNELESAGYKELLGENFMFQQSIICTGCLISPFYVDD